jgi:hypothetical protein
VSLYFFNLYPQKVSIAIMWYRPGCGEGLAGNGNCWERQGWFNLDFGQQKKVLPNKTFPDVGDDLSEVNRYFCFHARAVDGAKWSGPYVRGVTHSAFHRCDCLSYTNSDFLAGFRLLDIDDNDDFSCYLIP